MIINGDKLAEAFDIAQGNLPEKNFAYTTLDKMYNDFLMDDEIDERDYKALKAFLERKIDEAAMYVDDYQHIYDILYSLNESKIKGKKIKESEENNVDFIRHLVGALDNYLKHNDIDSNIGANGLYVWYKDPTGKAPELAKLVAREYNDTYVPVYTSYGEKSGASFIPNENAPKFLSDDGLNEEQRKIIYDIASEDYETGHPFSPEDAVEWFKSGEEEGIPAELAEEAADYYFEAFDDIRDEDNNRDFNEEDDPLYGYGEDDE